MKKLSALILVLILALSLTAHGSGAATPPSAEPAEKLTVHYIDVGQADSILIELPNAQTVLIDGGNQADGTTVVSYLRDQKITTLDYVVATHPHEDHIGGLPDVINSALKIKSVYMPWVATTTQIYEDFWTSMDAKGLSFHAAKSGVNILSVPNLQMDILAPVGDNYTNLNDWSAVIKLKYKETVFLFMGDAETAPASQITADMDADVIKIGHHGSEASVNDSFLQKITPDYAVISVGAKNTYGHPADTTLAALEKIGAEVFRTDEYGTIIMTSDGKNIRVDNKPASATSQSAPLLTTAALPPASSAAPIIPAPAQNQSITVYVTKTGEKYHRDGCRYLSQSKIAISLDSAQRAYEPCSVCNPPH